LSSMISDGDEALGNLVNVVIHESVHATIYLKSQSYFNESVASFVADRMTIDYLKQARGEQSREVQAYLKAEENSRRRSRRFREAYLQLEKVYSDSGLSDTQKLEEKEKILGQLRSELGLNREVNN